jgi:hypothetical protein
MDEPQRALYDDEKIKIGCDPNEVNGHIVQIGKNYHLFPRNVLDDLYRRESADSLRVSLRAMDESVLVSLAQQNISLERFGWVLAIAKVNDMEHYSHWLSQRNVGCAMVEPGMES